MSDYYRWIDTQHLLLNLGAFVEHTLQMAQPQPPMDHLLLTASRERVAAIITNRFGLSGRPIVKREELGQQYGISRRRVQEIEGQFTRDLGKVLLHPEVATQWHIPHTVSAEVSAISDQIVQRGPVVTERELIRLCERRYSRPLTAAASVGLRLLISMLKLKAIRQNSERLPVGIVPAWSVDQTYSHDSAQVETLIRRVHPVMRAAIRPLALPDIRWALGPQAKGTSSDQLLTVALKLCADIEQREDGRYQIAFPASAPLADQAYWLLTQAPAHEPQALQQLFSQLNWHRARSGLPADLDFFTLGGTLARDRRFRPVGNPGRWRLSTRSEADEDGDAAL